MKFLYFKEAPPIKKPSHKSIFFNCLIFLEETEPPYITFALILNSSFKYFFNLKKKLFKYLFFGIMPVPMDQIGS